MATIAKADQLYNQNHHITTWTGLTTTNTDGGPTSYASNGMGGVTVQITGTIGAGFGLSIQGSNDGVTWYTINDQANSPAAFTALGLKTIRDQPLYVRPLVTGGDGTTSINAIMAFQKSAFSIG